MGSGMSSGSNKKEMQEKRTDFLSKLEEDGQPESPMHDDKPIRSAPEKAVGKFLEPNSGSTCKATTKPPSSCSYRGG